MPEEAHSFSFEKQSFSFQADCLHNANMNIC